MEAQPSRQRLHKKIVILNEVPRGGTQLKDL
jgi:hypothetical protein